MEARFVVIVLVSLVPAGINGQTLKDAQDLIEAKLSVYDKRLRPVHLLSDTVSVGITSESMTVQSFDDITGIVTFQMIVYMSWTDHRLAWRKESHGNVSLIDLPTSDVWWPKLVMVNSPNYLYTPCQNAQKVRITNEGGVKLVSVDSLQALCTTDINYYPYDTQTCSIVIVPWGYPTRELRFERANITSFGDAEPIFTQNSAWGIGSSEAEVTNDKVSKVTMNLRLTRRHMYAVVNLIIPISTLAFLNTWVFILPPESGERTSYSITVLLSFVVYMGILNDNIPKGSEPLSRLSYLLILMIVYSTSVLFWTIISLHTYNKIGKKPVPRWLQTTTYYFRLGCFRWLYGRSAVGIKQSKEKDTDSLPEQNVTRTRVRRYTLSEIKEEDFKKDNTKVDAKAICITWNEVGEVVDMYSFVLHFAWWLFMVLSVYSLSIIHDTM